MSDFKAEVHKMDVRIANREDLDQILIAEQITQNPAFNLPEEMLGERIVIYLY